VAVFRTIYTISILSVMSVLAVGCASTGSASMANVGEKIKPVNAVAYGLHVNLHASDVPEFVAARFPRSQRINSGPFGANIEKCDGVSGAQEVVGMRSQRFQHAGPLPGERRNLIPHESAQSAVYVMSDSELAHREVTAAMSSRGRQCAVSKNVAVKPEGTGTEVPLLNKINISNVQIRVDGTPIVGVRTAAHETIEASGPSDASNYYQDLWAFAVGRAVITLTVVGSPQPFPTAEERRLLSVLYARAGRW